MTNGRRAITAAALAVLTVLVVAPPSQAAARVVTTGCATVTIIGARGAGQPQGTVQAGQLSGFGIQASGVARDAMNQFSPGTTVRYDRLIYPAYRALTLSYAWSVSQGVARLNVQVAYFVRNCPRTKIVLIGFGEGSHVVHLAAAALPPSTASHIVRVVLMADPIRNVDNTSGTLLFNLGQPVGGLYLDGPYGPGPVFTNGLQNGSRVSSFCHRLDGLCNSKIAVGFSPVELNYYQTAAPRALMSTHLWSSLFTTGVR